MKLTIQQCVEAMGHCWEADGFVMTSNPPQRPEHCKHCPATRIGVPVNTEEFVGTRYRYPEGQQ